MWRWQLKNLLNLHTRFVLRLVGVSCAIHLIFFFCIFFIYRGQNSTINLTIDLHKAGNATIVFLPLHKKISRAQNNVSAAGVAPAATSSPARAHTTPSLPVAAKKSSGNQKQLTSLAAPTATKNKKNSKKELKPTIKKEVITQKNKPEKKVAEKKQDSAALANNEKSNTAKKIEPTAPLPKPIISENTTSASALPDASPNNNELNTDNTIFVGQEDLMALQAQQAITGDITTHFKPPAGLKKGLSCALTLSIDRQGHSSVRITQPSGVKLFDIQARLALQKITIAPWMHGKELIINLKN